MESVGIIIMLMMLSVEEVDDKDSDFNIVN